MLFVARRLVGWSGAAALASIGCATAARPLDASRYGVMMNLRSAQDRDEIERLEGAVNHALPEWSRDTETDDVLEALGDAWLRGGEYDRAVEAYDRRLVVGISSKAEVHIDRANARIHQGRLDLAAIEVDESLDASTHEPLTIELLRSIKSADARAALPSIPRGLPPIESVRVAEMKHDLRRFRSANARGQFPACGICEGSAVTERERARLRLEFRARSMEANVVLLRKTLEKPNSEFLFFSSDPLVDALVLTVFLECAADEGKLGEASERLATLRLTPEPDGTSVDPLLIRIALAAVHRDANAAFLAFDERGSDWNFVHLAVPAFMRLGDAGSQRIERGIAEGKASAVRLAYALNGEQFLDSLESQWKKKDIPADQREALRVALNIR